MTTESTEKNGENGAIKPKMLKINEAAKYLDISVSALRQRVYAKEIAVYKIGNGLKFKPEDLDTWRESQRREAQQPTL